MRWLLALLFVVTPYAAPVRAAEPTPQQLEFFEKQVRPVLAEHCFACHGPKKQMSGLRLDSRAAILEGGDNGPALKPGDADASRLIQVIRHSGDLKMPPKKKLAAAEVEAITAWVKTGAPWPEPRATTTKTDAWKSHWAFQPVRSVTPPTVGDPAWQRTPIDAFILARLEEKNLKPSPLADRVTLLRRATYDLTGLPPTPEEIEAFVNDTSPAAWETVIDRLLGSPAYGERWGRHWLDVARYADTKGYVFFEDAPYPWSWTYRDYVVQALNEDKPYDRFVLEQIAADRLYAGGDASARRALPAMGFITAGGRFMSNPHDILDDRIDVVSRGLLGLTVGCARCHDHKFDPIPSRDYYSLYNVFASSIEPTPAVFQEPARTAEYEKFEKELAAREQKLKEFLTVKQAEVTGGARKRVAEYLLAVHSMRGQPDTEEFMLIADGTDINPAMVTRWRASMRRAEKANHPVFRPWFILTASEEKEFGSRALELIGRWSRKKPDGINPLIVKALEEKPPKNVNELAQVYGTVLNGIEQKWQDAFKQAATAQKPPPARLEDPAEEELRLVFHGPDAAPNVPLALFNELSLLPDRPSQGKLQELRKAVEQWRSTGPGAPPRAMVLEDAAVPTEVRVFLRGNPNNPGEPAPRRFLEVLAGKDRSPFKDGSGRLELARAIVDSKNPLTARVLVNRVWMHHFGAGLVRTPSDFGLRSEPPSHPELLDYLAARFMADGWSIKRLHRLILLSAVYQQQSRDRADGRAADPENVLLWRMNRRRLDFEATRDALLAVSGRLDRRPGGAAVHDLLSGNANRRTLYCYLDRLNVPGLMRSFDFPSPDSSSPQRTETTVPQQALFFMNNAFVFDSAKRLLQRSDVAGQKELRGKVERVHILLFGRKPTAEEAKLAEEFIGAGPAAAGNWERYVQALLLTNEFVFVD